MQCQKPTNDSINTMPNYVNKLKRLKRKKREANKNTVLCYVIRSAARGNQIQVVRPCKFKNIHNDTNIVANIRFSPCMSLQLVALTWGDSGSIVNAYDRNNGALSYCQHGAQQHWLAPGGAVSQWIRK